MSRPAGSEFFFTCSESGVFTKITDVVKGLTFTPDVLESGGASSSINTAEDPAGEDSGKAVRLQQYSNIALDNGAVNNPVSKDIIFMYALKYRGDPAKEGDACFGVTIGTDGSAATSGIKLQPYGAIWMEGRYAGTNAPIATGDSVARTGLYPEKGYTDNGLGNIAELFASGLVEGEAYIFAAVKRGNRLEHWFGDKLTGVFDVSQMDEEYQDYFNNVLFETSNMYIAHSSVEGGGSWEYPQDYLGIYLGYFDEAPNDLEETLPWTKNQWMAKNKVLPPSWNPL